MKKANDSLEFLLIEDNLGDVELMKDFIQELFPSPNITVARNYKELKSILKDHDTVYYVVLLDLSLPDKKGEPLINEILSHPKITCPVIILTGYADLDFSIKSISMGISDYLLKDELTSATLYKSIIYGIERCDFQNRLKDSENRFSYFFNLSPQPMWVYETESLRFINVNEAALIKYGYTEEEFYKLDLVQMYVPEEREQVEKTIESIDGKKISFSGNFKQLKKSGEEIEVEIYSTFLVLNERPCRIVITIDVTEKNKGELRLTQAIIKTQEEERNAIGSELHDNICQILAGSMLNLSVIKPHLNDNNKSILNLGIDNIKMASNEIRNLSHRLAPAFFEDMNLYQSLLQLLATMNPDGRFETHLNYAKELVKIKLKRDLQINLYRIMQEQLNNINKYSKASIINVNLTIFGGNLRFEISDNGVGFNEENVSKGIGFANMNRRAKLFAGNLVISSSPGNGCKIIITIPSAELTEKELQLSDI